MIHTPIKSRYDIFRTLVHELKLYGNAAEVGVFLGRFSIHNLTHWQKGDMYHLIDAWATRPPEHNKKIPWAAEDCQENMDEIYDRMLNNMEPYKDRICICRGFSTEVAEKVEDGFFDIIYIDALHSELACTDDLNAWYPKLKRGGLMAGDDYADWSDNEFGDIPHKYGWGVRSAVTKFCEDRDIQHFVSYANKEYPFPCWYFVKP